jgi:hypothetical protein
MPPMGQVSTAQKLAAAGRLAGRSRWVRGALAASQATFSSLRRVLGVLLLEMVGFLFICLALIGGFAAVREYRQWAAGKITAGKPIIALCFALTFAWFGVSSFWRAWRK